MTFDVEADGERLCVAASHPRLPRPLRFGYAVAELTPPYTLTFLAGDEVGSSLQIAGWTLEGLRTRGRGSSTLAFPERGALHATLRIRSCTAHPPRMRGARQGGTFATLRSPTQMLAADLDADGRDELLALGEDGSLQVLDAEDPSRGSSRRTDLATLDGVVSDVADIDGDCAFDLVAASSTGALVVDGATGASPAPVGPPARLARLGPFGPSGAAGLLVGNDHGLFAVPWPSGPIESVLERAVTALDVRREAGIVRLVASGPDGTAWIRVASSERRDETRMLAPDLATARGPGALANLDGAGGLDLALADGTRVMFGISTPSGVRVMNERDLGAPIVRIVASDLDGDCLDDIVVRSADGVWTAYAGPDGRPLGTPALGSVDVVTADVDGDGEIEVAVLGSGGRVTLWAP